MSANEKRPFSQSLKVFCDVSARYPLVKTISIGATETAREVVEYDPEMRNRVSELLVPLMTDVELGQIITRGQDLLNIDLSILVKPIVQYSVGVPSVCHQLALNACLEKQVDVTRKSRVKFTADDLKPAVERYVRESSDTLRASFDKALRRHKVRKFDNCRLILQTLAQGLLDGMLYSDILAGIRRSESEYPSGNLTLYLQQLTQEERGSILRAGVDGRYRFADPLYHTFAQLTLVEKPPDQLAQDSLVSLLASYSLTNVIKTDPDWDHLVTLTVSKAARLRGIQMEPPQAG